MKNYIVAAIIAGFVAGLTNFAAGYIVNEATQKLKEKKEHEKYLKELFESKGVPYNK